MYYQILVDVKVTGWFYLFIDPLRILGIKPA